MPRPQETLGARFLSRRTVRASPKNTLCDATLQKLLTTETNSSQNQTSPPNRLACGATCSTRALRSSASATFEPSCRRVDTSEAAATFRRSSRVMLAIFSCSHMRPLLLASIRSSATCAEILPPTSPRSCHHIGCELWCTRTLEVT